MFAGQNASDELSPLRDRNLAGGQGTGEVIADPWGRESSTVSGNDGRPTENLNGSSWTRFDFRSISAVTIGVAAVLGIAKQNLELGAVLGILLSYLWAAVAIIGPRSRSRVALWAIVLLSGLVATGLGFFVQTLLFGLMLRVTWVALVVIAMVFAMVTLACFGKRIRRWTIVVAASFVAIGFAFAAYQYSQTTVERWVLDHVYYTRRQHMLTLPTRYGADNRGKIPFVRSLRAGLGLARAESLSLKRMPAPEDLKRFAGLRHCKWAYLQYMEITPELLEALAAMPALENIGLLDCQLKSDWTPLHSARKLKGLRLYSMAFEDYSGLGGISTLEDVSSDTASQGEVRGSLVDELIQSTSLIHVDIPATTTDSELRKLADLKGEYIDRGELRLLSDVRLGTTSATVETLIDYSKVMKPNWPALPVLKLTPEQREQIAKPMEEWEQASTVEATMPK
ncbi:MAG: hypothetical protein AAGG44_01630 [Planctomycetota bacterium]